MSSQARVAVVTGGGSGIGRAVALALADDGYAVVVAGRREDPLRSIVAEAAATGLLMLAVPTDVRDEASAKALFAKTKDAFGRLDLLFNNAGTGAPPVSLEEVTFDTAMILASNYLRGQVAAAFDPQSHWRDNVTRVGGEEIA